MHKHSCKCTKRKFSIRVAMYKEMLLCPDECFFGCIDARHEQVHQVLLGKQRPYFPIQYLLLNLLMTIKWSSLKKETNSKTLR